jgi:hypothetical protein
MVHVEPFEQWCNTCYQQHVSSPTALPTTAEAAPQFQEPAAPAAAAAEVGADYLLLCLCLYHPTLQRTVINHLSLTFSTYISPLTHFSLPLAHTLSLVLSLTLALALTVTTDG